MWRGMARCRVIHYTATTASIRAVKAARDRGDVSTHPDSVGTAGELAVVPLEHDGELADLERRVGEGVAARAVGLDVAFGVAVRPCVEREHHNIITLLNAWTTTNIEHLLKSYS